MQPRGVKGDCQMDVKAVGPFLVFLISGFRRPPNGQRHLDEKGEIETRI